MMQDWQQRVISEYDELSAKIVKLSDFIHGSESNWYNLDDTDKVLLSDQLYYMQQYKIVLKMRIDRFDV